MKNAERHKKSPKSGILILMVIALFTFIIVSNFLITDKSWYHPKMGLRDQVWDTVRVMAVDDQITCSYVGEDGRTPIQWERYTWLAKNASIEELETLLKSDNANIRGMAFKILNIKKYDIAFQYMTPTLGDTSTWVYELCGCLGESYLLRDYMIYTFLRYELVNESGQTIRPTQAQLNELSKYWNNDRLKVQVENAFERTVK
jgi:hypothetical protein